MEKGKPVAGFTVKRLAHLAVFTAVALIIHVLESLVPLPVSVPGIKLGLANAVTLFMLFWSADRYRTADVFAVLLCRIVLSALIAGRPAAVIYGLCGGMLAVTAQLITRRFVTDRQIWVCGAIGAVFHNIGQIAAAIIITGTFGIIVYLPVLTIAGIATGIITGLIAGLTVNRMERAAQFRGR